MPLMAHKLVASMLGISNEIYFEAHPEEPAVIKSFANYIMEAEKFDFGSIPMERVHSEKYSEWEMPGLTEDELEAYDNNLIPLPAPISWFEYTIPAVNFQFRDRTIKKTVAGLLIRQKDDAWQCTRIDMNQLDDGDWFCHFVPIVNSMHKGGQGIDLGIVGQKAIDFYKSNKNEFQRLVDCFKDCNKTAIYMALMLCSKTTEILSQSAPQKLNKARLKSGKIPLFSHSIVRIVPERFIRESVAEAGRTHKSPRLHWRRSHLRIYNRGMEAEYKIVIARCLVGKPELGTVTHEYKVET
jgi:hypothetical protein